MINKLDKLFLDKTSMKLMTHVVAGYPDMETTELMVLLMEESGVDMVEIQIPFSDPIADGVTIAGANQMALENGATPAGCLKLIEKLASKVKIPLLVMTYGNILYHWGVEEFIKKSVGCGVSGLIVPDLPFDWDQGYYEIAEKYSCDAIRVVSPGISSNRLDSLLKEARGFVYTTLRVGVTGARSGVDERGLKFLGMLKERTELPIAAGFGISSREMLDGLRGLADMGVIGSHILDIFNQEGLPGVGFFIRECKM